MGVPADEDLGPALHEDLGLAVSVPVGGLYHGDESGLLGADGELRIRHGLVAVQPVLSVTDVRPALPLHRRQAPMEPLSRRVIAHSQAVSGDFASVRA